ncbi:LysM peptidoglycan-binding domain-containing protein [Nonomuraea pusilla]|uniref:LysM peptidoglycan-binding domain-containing protein n=1 Tax=Nonomuraea pusilla TaxID=46177 RepID=UPI00332B8CB2
MVVIGMALLALGGFWLGTRAAGHASVAVMVPEHPALPWVDVRTGDTVWGIADAVARDGRDPEALAEEIKRLNRLPDGKIRPGTRLYIPRR